MHMARIYYPDFEPTYPTEPAPLNAAPRMPRQRDIGPAHAVMAGLLLLVFAGCVGGLLALIVRAWPA
jgi:hypothetical protein